MDNKINFSSSAFTNTSIPVGERRRYMKYKSKLGFEIVFYFSMPQNADRWKVKSMICNVHI